MQILYKSTRSDAAPITASQAILKGLADDGGLFVPTEFPKLEVSLQELAEMDYKGVAYEVMKLFLTDYTEEELKKCIENAYDSKFDTEVIAPLAEADGAFYLELYHGKTIAFKDMALSILPHLMITAAKKNHEEKEIVILTATSGDTGKAALEGFAKVPGTRIMVFFPQDGVSPVQKKQMLTQEGDNTCVIGIKGNFDDAQTGVKKIFTNPALREEMAEKGFCFSSANSINIGRLVPQVVYYVYSYTRLLKEGRIEEEEPVNFVVPTGNFGNILAAHYADLIGLPVGKLICASNKNKVLFDFFETGKYDRNRPFFVTSSPSMDILVSSNLERLIYLACGEDAEKNAALMKSLSGDGTYTVDDEMKELMSDFVGGYASEEETEKRIGDLFATTGYCIDPHTAVASCVYEQYKDNTGDTTKAVIVSTASPYKFAGSVMKAIGVPVGDDDLANCDSLSEAIGTEVPEAVTSLKNAPIRHTGVCEKDEMEKKVREFLGI